MAPPSTLPADFSGWDAASASTPPPATLPANFAAWDDAAKSAPAAKTSFTPVDAGNEVAEMLGGAAKNLAKVSGPNVLYEVFRKNFPQLGLKPVLGMPTANEVGATGVSMMIPGAEGEAEIGAPDSAAEGATEGATSKAASVLEHPGVSPWVSAVKTALKKELMKIPGADLAETALESARGFAKGAPEAPKPPVPGIPAAVPETNGVPWGSGGQGPLDLRGKTIPPEVDGLRKITQATVNKAVPPTGDTAELNTFVKSAVDKHLAQGNIAAAEDILDTAAKTADSKWTPPDRPRITPSVANIRENLSRVQNAEAQPSRPTPDSMDDKALQQEMNQDLERHGWAAESEARREFIARNSTGVTKSDLTGVVEKPVKYTKTPGVPSLKSSSGSAAGMAPGEVDDLMSKMQQMLDAAKKAKSSPN